MSDNDHRDPSADMDEPAVGDYGRLLLQSAQLDRPAPGKRQQAIEQVVLARRRSEHALRRPRLVPGLALGLAGGLAVALGAVAWLRSTTAPKLSPEPVQPVVSPALNPPPAPRPVRPACTKTVAATGLLPLLDDMEDQNARVLLNDGRSGSWSLFGDGTGQVEQQAAGVLHPSRIPGARGKSRFALHVAGGRFSDWGLNVSADLSPPNCYDASVYAGVQFWTRGKGRVQVGARMVDVVEVKFGGLCSKDCYNVHKTGVDLGPTWVHHTVRWTELEQGAFPGHVEFDASRLQSIDFSVDAADTPFDVWIDDVSFLPR